MTGPTHDKAVSEAFVQDTDFTLYLGDVREVLAGLETGSVDCVVTSPPYWGLRDYGTGLWDGGDPDCDHLQPVSYKSSTLGASTGGRSEATHARSIGAQATPYARACGKCGARRVDQQLGLEPTPDLYVQNMVAVFREVRRVLAPHGTCWVNLGDSYAAGRGVDKDGNPRSPGMMMSHNSGEYLHPASKISATPISGRSVGPGIKPKDLVGIPWRVAFALQADGWYLRSDIVWSKPNPMPESVTDRPTKAHEYVFLLTKQPRYWFDQEAVREPHARLWDESNGGNMAHPQHAESEAGRISQAWNHRGSYPLPNPAGRNVRSVWEIATQPYPEAHFATYPEELVRRCILAGCPEWVCRVCGKPRERIVNVDYENPGNRRNNGRRDGEFSDATVKVMSGGQRLEKRVTSIGWSDCGHNQYRPGQVLDPFIGSGTTALVARRHGRHTIGIELNPAYAELAARRLSQLSLLAEASA